MALEAAGRSSLSHTQTVSPALCGRESVSEHLCLPQPPSPPLRRVAAVAPASEVHPSAQSLDEEAPSSCVTDTSLSPSVNRYLEEHEGSILDQTLISLYHGRTVRVTA